MTKFSELVEPLRKCVHPLVFETGNSDWPYGIVGTCFLVKFTCGVFAVTFEHVVGSNDVKALMLFPSHQKMKPVRFSRKITIEHEVDQLEKIVLLAVDPKSLHQECIENNPPVLQIFSSPNSWGDEPENYNYMVFGWPTESKDIDYSIKSVLAEQHSFSGTYAGASAIDYCFKLNIVSISGPENIDGYSGSPVFCWKKGATKIDTANFCGIAVRGTFSSGLAHVLERDYLATIERELCS